MLKGIKSLFQGGSADGIDLSRPGAKFLKNDLNRLNEAKPKPGTRAIRYVFFGKDEEVLLDSLSVRFRALIALDRAKDALPIAEQLVAGRRRLLGQAHPKTEESRALLAIAQAATTGS